MTDQASTDELAPRPVRVDGFGGVAIVGDERGPVDAPVALLLHGGGQTRHSWGGTATAVAKGGWRAVTLDSRGHGESDWASGGDYRLASFAGDVQHYIDAATDEPPFVIGASLGGLTAILLAGELAPGIARGIVLVDIVPDMEPAGADRIQAFMAENMASGYGSLD